MNTICAIPGLLLHLHIGHLGYESSGLREFAGLEGIGGLDDLRDAPADLVIVCLLSCEDLV
jgi:hypothetical protein